jgi:pimeloyl-ACP methyl ester carboxylesterase
VKFPSECRAARRRALQVCLVYLAVGLLPGTALARQAGGGDARPDYAEAAKWLCRPDLAQNRCRVDLDATVVAADGALTVERFRPSQDPAIDCFFIYPTVSNDAGWQSDFVPDEAEWDDIRLQFARFGAVCRQFAPLYRQGTLRRLRAPGGGPPPIGEPPPPGVGGYADVRDAWNWYLANENHGRGVVLIGHSQGGAMIARLVADELDGKPAQDRMVSALVLGAPVMVPPGQDVGGSFRTVPLCRSRDQTGCVITYATFRDRLPPPADARFGRAREGLRVACVNPASLGGGAGEPRSYFLTRGFLNGSGGTVQPDWVQPPRPTETPFVTTPGLVSTECVSAGDFDYLALHVNADPTDPRTDDLGGQIVRATGVDPSWGLHLIDVDHSMGTLIDIVRDQTAAYVAGSSR